jgi:hypothetical protein
VYGEPAYVEPVEPAYVEPAYVEPAYQSVGAAEPAQAAPRLEKRGTLGFVTWGEEHDKVVDVLAPLQLTEMQFYKQLTDNGIMDDVDDPDVLWRDFWYFSDRQVHLGTDVVNFGHLHSTRPMIGDSCSTAKEAAPRTTSSTPEPAKSSEGRDWGTSKDRELKEMMEREKRERQERWQREEREKQGSTPSPGGPLDPESPSESPDPYEDEFEEDDPLSPQKAVELKSEPSGYGDEDFEDGSLDEYMQQSRDNRIVGEAESVSEESDRGPPPRPETSMGGHGDREYSMDYSSPSNAGHQESLQATRPFEPGELAVDEFYRIVDEGELDDGLLVAPDMQKRVVKDLWPEGDSERQKPKHLALTWQNPADKGMDVLFLSSSELTGSDDPLLTVRPESRSHQKVGPHRSVRFQISIHTPVGAQDGDEEVAFLYVLGPTSVVGAIEFTVEFRGMVVDED